MTQVLIGDMVVEVEPSGKFKDGEPIYRISDPSVLPEVRVTEVADVAREAALARARTYSLEDREAVKLAADGLLRARDQVKRGWRVEPDRESA